MRNRLKKIILPLAILVSVTLLCGTASALPSYYNYNVNMLEPTLSLGDYGPDVEAVQRLLLELGLYSGGMTGVYDTQTKVAVIRLQYLLGTVPDGKYGPLTAEACRRFISEQPKKSMVSIQKLPLANAVIGIDPGHQEKADFGLELMSPSGNWTKYRTSRGSIGIKTGMPEYKINLLVGKKLEDLLESAGATVIMSRQENSVSLSNLDRSMYMNNENVDFWIRIHCDASTSSSKSGANVLIPSSSSNAKIYDDSLALGTIVLHSFCKATDAAKGSVNAVSSQTGFNWSQSPVITIEMGYLSNPKDDLKLCSDSYQTSCAMGIYNGILIYFNAYK